MIPASIAAMAAFFLDTALGDPQTRWHPVAVLGRFIGWLDREPCLRCWCSAFLMHLQRAFLWRCASCP